MSTGIIATAIILIIGYLIVSKIVGLAFRLVVPLVLLVVLGGVLRDNLDWRSAAIRMVIGCRGGMMIVAP